MEAWLLKPPDEEEAVASGGARGRAGGSHNSILDQAKEDQVRHRGRGGPGRGWGRAGARKQACAGPHTYAVCGLRTTRGGQEHI